MNEELNILKHSYIISTIKTLTAQFKKENPTFFDRT
jgi:serum/glucocorticoid-regulated kinase 2